MAKEILHALAHPVRRKIYSRLHKTPHIEKEIVKNLFINHYVGNLENPFNFINIYLNEKEIAKKDETKASEYIFGILKKMTVYEFVFSSNILILNLDRLN